MWAGLGVSSNLRACPHRVGVLKVRALSPAGAVTLLGCQERQTLAVRESRVLFEKTAFTTLASFSAHLQPVARGSPFVTPLPPFEKTASPANHPFCGYLDAIASGYPIGQGGGRLPPPSNMGFPRIHPPSVSSMSGAYPPLFRYLQKMGFAYGARSPLVLTSQIFKLDSFHTPGGIKKRHRGRKFSECSRLRARVA